MKKGDGVWIGVGVSSFIAAMLLSWHLFPNYTDEMLYFNEVRGLIEGGSLSAPVLQNENESLIGGFGPHGFFYALLHAPLSFILPLRVSIFCGNVLLTVIGLYLLMSNQSLPLKSRRWLVAFFMSSYLMLFYALSYMQESIHFFFAVLLSGILLKIDGANDKTKQQRLLWVYVGIVLIATLSRMSWVFWMLPALLYSDRSKKGWAFKGITVLLILSGYLIFRSLSAVYPLGFVQALSQGIAEGGIPQGIGLVLENFWLNIKRFCDLRYDPDLYYSLQKVSLVVGVIWLLYQSIVHKSRLFFSGLLIFGAYLFALFALYDAWGWRELRALWPCLIFVVIGVGYSTDAWKYLPWMVGLQCAFFPIAIQRSADKISQMKDSWEVAEKLIKQDAFLWVKAQPASGNLILLDYSFQGDGNPMQCLLPLQNTEGEKLRYAMNYRDAIPWEQYENSIVLFLATKSPENLSEGWALEYQNAFFKAYKGMGE